MTILLKIAWGNCWLWILIGWRKSLSPSLSGDSRDVVVSTVISREAYAQYHFYYGAIQLVLSQMQREQHWRICARTIHRSINQLPWQSQNHHHHRLRGLVLFIHYHKSLHWRREDLMVRLILCWVCHHLTFTKELQIFSVWDPFCAMERKRRSESDYFHPSNVIF